MAAQTQINDPIPHTRIDMRYGGYDIPLPPHSLDKNECCPLSLCFENCHIFYKGLPKTLPYVCQLLGTTKVSIFLERTTLIEVLTCKLSHFVLIDNLCCSKSCWIFNPFLAIFSQIIDIHLHNLGSFSIGMEECLLALCQVKNFMSYLGVYIKSLAGFFRCPLCISDGGRFR